MFDTQHLFFPMTHLYTSTRKLVADKLGWIVLACAINGGEWLLCCILQPVGWMDDDSSDAFQYHDIVGIDSEMKVCLKTTNEKLFDYEEEFMNTQVNDPD